MARKHLQTPVIEDAQRRSREMDREWHDYSTPADPVFAMLCAQSLVMWMAGAEPDDIADWLVTRQDGCIVNLREQVLAVRGLKKYRRGGFTPELALPALPPGRGANDEWFRANSHKIVAAQADYVLDDSRRATQPSLPEMN